MAGQGRGAPGASGNPATQKQHSCIFPPKFGTRFQTEGIQIPFLPVKLRNVAEREGHSLPARWAAESGAPDPAAAAHAQCLLPRPQAIMMGVGVGVGAWRAEV